ncbi:hypothetical protein L596_021072 [Steinernema carpocapsae]|uniref:Uncharacterized protein n=1 Tax=Steinernema carpocapsae TaxID=34508 RepID=A0A4U5MVM3_STECR|nr:hypothetical protein L596_021072 [Steinernema carpocapsae]
MLRLLALLSVLFAVVHGGFYIGQTVNCNFTYSNSAGYGACGSQINAATQNLIAVGPSYWSTPNPNNDPVCKHVCIRVNYGGKSRTVPVKDKCSGCNANQFSLSQPAFQFFAPLSTGHIYGATCTFVRC